MLTSCLIYQRLLMTGVDLNQCRSCTHLDLISVEVGDRKIPGLPIRAITLHLQNLERRSPRRQ
jgi:hypothetical protein